MSRSQATNSEEITEYSEKRVLINTVLDAFCFICGFYADDILSMKEQVAKVIVDKNISISNKSAKDRSESLSALLKILFKEIIKNNPNLERAINFFLDNRLWEIVILSQICSENIDARKDLANKCSLIVSNSNITKNDNNDIHFLYTIQYLKYLSLSLLNDIDPNNINFLISQDKKLALLYRETNQHYKKTNSLVLLKLSGMIIGKKGNIEYSEKIYKQYITLLFNDDNKKQEIGRAFYDLGKIIEYYSCRGPYTKKTIHAAFNYYRIAYEYDSNNYMAGYKKAFLLKKERISSENIIEIMRLRDSLNRIIEEKNDTLSTHIYQYNTINYLIIYNLITWKNSKNNQKYLDELESDYFKIESIWKYLYPYDGDILWKNELKKHLRVRIREKADILLTKRNETDKNLQKKLSNVNKT